MSETPRRSSNTTSFALKSRQIAAALRALMSDSGDDCMDLVRQALMTQTRISGFTSACNRIGIRYTPRALIGSCRSICRFSMCQPRGRGAALVFGRLESFALQLNALKVAGGGFECDAAGQQIIAGVAVGDFHDLSRLAEVFNGLAKNDFHGGTPIRTRLSAPVAASPPRCRRRQDQAR